MTVQRIELPIKAGKYVQEVGPFYVAKARKQCYTLYTVLAHTGKIVGKQFSVPNLEDCLQFARKAVTGGLISPADLTELERRSRLAREMNPGL